MRTWFGSFLRGDFGKKTVVNGNIVEGARGEHLFEGLELTARGGG